MSIDKDEVSKKTNEFTEDSQDFETIITEVKSVWQVLDSIDNLKPESKALRIALQRIFVLYSKIAVRNMERFKQYDNVQNHPQLLFAVAEAQNTLEADKLELERLLKEL